MSEYRVLIKGKGRDTASSPTPMQRSVALHGGWLCTPVAMVADCGAAAAVVPESGCLSRGAGAIGWSAAWCGCSVAAAVSPTVLVGGRLFVPDIPRFLFADLEFGPSSITTGSSREPLAMMAELGSTLCRFVGAMSVGRRCDGNSMTAELFQPAIERLTVASGLPRWLFLDRGVRR